MRRGGAERVGRDSQTSGPMRETFRLKLTSGRVAASHVISSYVDAILKEGVI